MAYDEELAERVRRALAEESDVRETKMFGGLAFMVNGKMVACVRTVGALLVRVAGERQDQYLECAGASSAVMGKNRRPMGDGWIEVDAAALGDKGLQFWMHAVLDFNAASA